MARATRTCAHHTPTHTPHTGKHDDAGGAKIQAHAGSHERQQRDTDGWIGAKPGCRGMPVLGIGVAVDAHVLHAAAVAGL